MLQLKRTNSEDKDFIHLVHFLDAELAERDGDEHAFYNQFNKISVIKHAIVAYENNEAVACGAIKEFAPQTMEVKRMYTLLAYRGQGIAAKVLNELEIWAMEMNIEKFVLETGKNQPEAIALYTKCGYEIIPNYGQYAEIENSICFEKKIK